VSGAGRNDRTIYLPDILFPLAVGPENASLQAYANSQIHAVASPQSNPKNFAYPWRDTYCEERQWSMPLCPGKTGHQGVDIRASGPENKTFVAVAMDDAIVTSITKNTTVILRAKDYSCRYLHMDFDSIQAAGVQVGKQVKRGQPIGKVSNIMGQTPSTSIHLHFDCHKVINGTNVHLPVYSSLVHAYRKAWGLAPMNKGGELDVDPLREVSTGGTVPTPTGPVVIDSSLPKTFQTKNYGAITPQTEPNAWPDYIKTWPQLNTALQIRDKFGKIIPAFQSDESGIGVWWYWMVKRAGFGPAGSVSFEQIALKYSGAQQVDDDAVAPYVLAYSGTPDRPGLSSQYFGRFVPKSESMSLADKEVRWRIAQTLFHHEAGRKMPFDRTTFERGVGLGSAVLDGTSIPGSPGGTTPKPTGPVAGPTGSTEGPVCASAPGTMEIVVGRFTLRVAPGTDDASVARMVDLLDKRR
jgi:murein DD-endopeptidase MepM/ murein hydrolase activator NlpD